MVLAALDFMHSFERYSESLSGADRAFAGALIRLTKGCVTAWRIWLIEAHPEHRALLVPIVPVSKTYQRKLASAERR